METMWRNECIYGDGSRDAVEVITFEMYDLCNVDIPDTVYNKYIVPNRENLKAYEELIRQIEVLLNDSKESEVGADSSDRLETEKDYRNLAEEIVSLVSFLTHKNIKYVLWLAEKENVERYYEGSLENMVEYETSDTIFSDLGEQGFLFGYEEMPSIIK